MQRSQTSELTGRVGVNRSTVNITTYNDWKSIKLAMPTLMQKKKKKLENVWQIDKVGRVAPKTSQFCDGNDLHGKK